MKLKPELEAGRTTPAPPVGRDLGPHGVILAEACRRYNDATRGQEGRIVPAVVTVYEDRSFDVRLTTPLTSALLREGADVEKGAPSPNGRPIETVTLVMAGHHRDSVASYQGIEWVDAQVTEFGAGLWRGEGMKAS